MYDELLCDFIYHWKIFESCTKRVSGRRRVGSKKCRRAVSVYSNMCGFLYWLIGKLFDFLFVGFGKIYDNDDFPSLFFYFLMKTLENINYFPPR